MSSIIDVDNFQTRDLIINILQVIRGAAKETQKIVIDIGKMCM